MKPLRFAQAVKSPKPARRGFAAMHPDTRRAICSAGGKALAAKRGASHMARIGRIGGKK